MSFPSGVQMNPSSMNPAVVAEPIQQSGYAYQTQPSTGAVIDVAALEVDPDYEMVDTWQTEGLGEIRVFAHKTRNLFKLHKKLELQTRFGASPQEINLLELRLKELPQEVTLAAGNYRQYEPSQPLFSWDNPQNDIYLDYSSHNLRKHVLELQRQGLKIGVQEGLGYFGFLMGLGSFMEQGLEFHRSVCLKNLLVMDREGLQLMNPYVSDNHTRLVIDEYIRPIIKMGQRWVPELFVDERLRAEFAKTDPEVHQLNSAHRKHIKQMHVDCCLTFLSLATTEEEHSYVSPTGLKNPAAIERGIQIMLDMGYPWELINIIRSVLLPKQHQVGLIPDYESIPTFIEVNEGISPELRELLMSSIISSKPLLEDPKPNEQPHMQGNLIDAERASPISHHDYPRNFTESTKQEISGMLDNSPFLFRTNPSQNQDYGYGEHNLESLINMTPDQRHDKPESVQRNAKVSSLIKGSIQSHEVNRVQNHLQQNQPSPLASAAVHTDFKTEQQQSKVTKDSLVYSAGEDEKAAQLQKSAISGLSEDQLSSHLISDQQAFLRHPTFQSEPQVANSVNIQIQDFSRPQELGKQIIQEVLPANPVAPEVQSIQGAAFKKSSKRLSQAEATEASSSKRELPPLAPMPEPIHQSAVQTRLQQTHTVVSASNQEQRVSPVQRLPLGSIGLMPEQNITFKPMTAAPQSEPAVTLVSGTGHSTPSEHSQRTDRVMKQYQPLVQMPIQVPQPQIKPTTSSLLAGKQTFTQPQQSIQQKSASPVVLSSTGAQIAQQYSTVERRCDSGVEQSQRTSRTQGRPLELRSSGDHSGQIPQAIIHPEEPVHITRTVAATPEVLEYVRTHSGQLPQDTVVTHPPKLIAEYTVDAEGNRIHLSKPASNPVSSLKVETAQTQTRVSNSNLVTRKIEQDQGVKSSVREEQNLAATKPQIRSFGEERVHQIQDEVIIENKPYIIEPNTGKKIYIDPNNLSQYVPLFQKQSQQTVKTQEQHVKVGEGQSGMKGVLRTSGRAVSGQPVNPAEQTRQPNLSPNTQVVRVPQGPAAAAGSGSSTRVGGSEKVQSGKSGERRAPEHDEGSRSRSRHQSQSKRVKIREGEAEGEVEEEAKSGRRHRKQEKKEREKVIRIPMEQAEEFLANYHKKQREATELDLLGGSGSKGQSRRVEEGYSLARGIQRVGGHPDSERRVEGLSKGPTAHGPAFSVREPAHIKIEPRPLDSRTLLPQSSYDTYQYQTATLQGSGGSTRYVQGTSWPVLGESPRVLPTQIQPSVGGVTMAMGYSGIPQPGVSTVGLGHPQLHNLPGLNFHKDLENTLQKIIHRSFN